MENNLIKTAIKASIDAGLEILKIYNTDFNIEYKEDSSPLTIADKNAHLKISEYLGTTDIPVLSEEGRSIPFTERRIWNQLWIVDPLDGTKEFIKKNDEFTVNIALVVDNKPIMGVIYAPVLDIVYFGEIGNGSYRYEKASELMSDPEQIIKGAIRLPIVNNLDYYGVVASRSHMSTETEEFISDLKTRENNIKIVSKGSSLKLCMVAEGEAKIYPRFAPTSEWDTAAGHAIVSAAGGKVVRADNPKEDIVYNKEDILNPWFIVYGRS